jgi:hypothetical protein
MVTAKVKGGEKGARFTAHGARNTTREAGWKEKGKG